MSNIEITYNNVDFVKLNERETSLVDKVQQEINNLPALNILSNNILLDKTIKETEAFIKGKENFIVFGTGGSNLGAKALINILQGNEINNILFYDNIDPIYFENSIKKINLSKTGFIIISKSGSTPETLSQLACLIQIFSQKNNLNFFYKNSLIITEEKSSPLYDFAMNNKCTFLKHEKNIGGRYSIFSNVGIVPALIAGINVKKIYAGALSLNDYGFHNRFNEMNNLNLYNIANFFKYCNFSSRITNSVIMTYSDSLFNFGKWYLQLWAESIGKNQRGITAIHSVGTTDQHSQLQLYLDGPKDKFFTFVTTNHSNLGLKLHSETMKNYRVDYLMNKTMGDLMQAEQQATIDTFKKNNFQFREIYLPSINEFIVGQLFALSIIETIASCYYLEVNPFDQPAVEQGKKLTKEYLL